MLLLVVVVFIFSECLIYSCFRRILFLLWVKFCIEIIVLFCVVIVLYNVWSWFELLWKIIVLNGWVVIFFVFVSWICLLIVDGNVFINWWCSVLFGYSIWLFIVSMVVSWVSVFCLLLVIYNMCLCGSSVQVLCLFVGFGSNCCVFVCVSLLYCVYNVCNFGWFVVYFCSVFSGWVNVVFNCVLIGYFVFWCVSVIVSVFFGRFVSRW